MNMATKMNTENFLWILNILVTIQPEMMPLRIRDESENDVAAILFSVIAQVTRCIQRPILTTTFKRDLKISMPVYIPK